MLRKPSATRLVYALLDQGERDNEVILAAIKKASPGFRLSAERLSRLRATWGGRLDQADVPSRGSATTPEKKHGARKKRSAKRIFTGEFKLAVAKHAILKDADISRIARTHGISRLSVTEWRNLLLEKGEAAFDDELAFHLGPEAFEPPTEEKLGEIFSALSNQDRRTILSILKGGEARIPEIHAKTTLSKGMVTAHLRQLKSAGLVKHTTRSNVGYYTLNIARLDHLRTWFASYGLGTDEP